MLRSETAEQPARTAAALKGLRLYQQARRQAPAAPMPVIHRIGRARLRDYGGSGPIVLFVPSQINPPTVLDLDPERSLLRWLAGQGVRPMLLDWGMPGADERDLSVAGHVETMLLPLIDAIGEPVTLVGYCLGGTMALAAAALRPVRGLVTMAAPWRFDGYPAAMRSALKDLWDETQGATDALGVLPMEVLQTAFWRLDPARTIAKYEGLADRSPDDPRLQAFIRLEDWANDGPPLTRGAARELLLRLFMEDASGRSEWSVAGRAIRLADVAGPVLEIVSTTDRIVPAAAAHGLGERLELNLGHVGMIVGGRAKALVWEPLARWLSSPRQS